MDEPETPPHSIHEEWPQGPDSVAALPRPRNRREADEWLLVLRAEGFTPKLGRGLGGFEIAVAPEEVPRAAASLEAWRLERAERAERSARTEEADAAASPPAHPFETALAYVLALGLLAFHLGLEASGRHRALIEVGSSQTDAVLAGHLERLVTALTLHSDLPHVLGNTLFGGFFLAFLAPRLGLGVALLVFLVTGALGNFANALYYGVAHDSVGASTGVFGLVGVLAGLAAWHRQRTAPPGRGAWVALGAGLGILAMLGTGGPRVDVSAHLFGLVAGALTGGAIAIPLAARPPKRWPTQVISLALSVAILAHAWRRALLA